MKTPRTIREQYLLNPFYKFLQDSDARIENKDLIKVLQAPTGFGKTYAETNEFIPQIFESEQKKLVVYAVPNVENIDADSFTEAGQENKYYFTTNVDEAFRWIKLGRNVVLAVHISSCVTVQSNAGIIANNLLTLQNILLGLLKNVILGWV